MEDKKNSLLDDLNSPLDKIQRAWLRRTIMIIISPIAIVMLAVAGILDGIEMARKWW